MVTGLEGPKVESGRQIRWWGSQRDRDDAWCRIMVWRRMKERSQRWLPGFWFEQLADNVAYTERKDWEGTHFRGSKWMINSVFPIQSVRSCKHLDFISGWAILYLGMHLWRKIYAAEANLKVVSIWMAPEAWGVRERAGISPDWGGQKDFDKAPRTLSVSGASRETLAHY